MRKSKKYSREYRPLNIEKLTGYTTYQLGVDGNEYKVHQINEGKKEYVCPGCNQLIFVGEKHVVVWTEDTILGPQHGIDMRRHWHESCWNHRGKA